MKIETIDRGWMIANAIGAMSRERRRGVPLWSLVRDICGVGSGSAHEICRELGWDPDAKGVASLPTPKQSKPVRLPASPTLPPANVLDDPGYWLGAVASVVMENPRAKREVEGMEREYIKSPEEVAADARAFDGVRRIMSVMHRHYQQRMQNDFVAARQPGNR